MMPFRRSTVTQSYGNTIYWWLYYRSCFGYLALVSVLYYESVTKDELTFFLISVTGVGVIISFSKVSPEAQVFSLTRWIAAFYATTLATNVICTCTSSYWDTTFFVDFTYSAMIAFRIWSVDRDGGKYRETKSTLKPVLAIIIESGAIYSTFLTILLAVYLSHNWVSFILSLAVSSFHNGTNHSISWTWIDDPNHCEIVHTFIYLIVWLTWYVGNCVQHDHCTGGPLLSLAKMVARTVPPWRLSKSATGNASSASKVDRNKRNYYHCRWIAVNGEDSGY